ncbi:MAG: MFS transporter [Xanthobacteraceae bacterium]|jgi:PAT family beta-lactamase induction signal transducer AmpG|nr:MFS transporter [Xanthobacteraceae bacterium]
MNLTAAEKPGWRAALAVYLKPRVLVILMLGFSAGLPLALSGSTLAVWMRQSGVDLGTIGLFTLVGTPYTLKFLWAPVVDALDAPVLSKLLGRRRGWLVLSQILLMAAIVFLAFCNPAASPWLVAFGALLVATASATQDIVIDAFRVESLEPSEQAAGMASYVATYRIGMVVSGAGALYLVEGFERWGFGLQTAWTFGYLAMAVFVLVGIVTAIFATEPRNAGVGVGAHAGNNALKRVFAVAVAAFRDFLARDLALVILIFVVFYKLCDAFAGAMTTAFVIDLGFSRTDYADVVKVFGLAATLIGGFAGGFLARAYPMVTCLWIGAFLQMASNFVFSWQAWMGMNYWALIVTILAENFTGAIGTVFIVAYLSALCQSPLHTATQFALLTAVAAMGRIYLTAGSGYLAEITGWTWFFAISALVAIPSMFLLWWLQAGGHFRSLGPVKITAGDD